MDREQTFATLQNWVEQLSARGLGAGLLGPLNDKASANLLIGGSLKLGLKLEGHRLRLLRQPTAEPLFVIKMNPITVAMLARLLAKNPNALQIGEFLLKERLLGTLRVERTASLLECASTASRLLSKFVRLRR